MPKYQTPFKVNPVKAICKKFDCTDNYMGIVELNDNCYDICTSFGGSMDQFAQQDCTKACKDFVDERKMQIFGKDSCDRQVPYPGVNWNQGIDDFLPFLMLKGLNPEQALYECNNLCDSKSPNTASECKEKCLLYYSAVEDYGGRDSKGESKDEKVSKSQGVMMNNTSDSSKDGSSKRNMIVLFCILFAMIALGMFFYKK
jgi:hypothetical protein